MKNIRQSINENRFPEFVKNYLLTVYQDKDYPKWIVDALKAVNIELY